MMTACTFVLVWFRFIVGYCFHIRKWQIKDYQHPSVITGESLLSCQKWASTCSAELRRSKTKTNIKCARHAIFLTLIKIIGAFRFSISDAQQTHSHNFQSTENKKPISIPYEFIIQEAFREAFQEAFTSYPIPFLVSFTHLCFDFV